jgi:hypothetical protein
MRPRRRYSLYVIRLSESARSRIDPPGKNPNLPCLYVGYTSKTPLERFIQHKTDPRLGSRIVRRFGETLLPEFYEIVNPIDDESDALRVEAELATGLRGLGYAVYGRHGERVSLPGKP